MHATGSMLREDPRQRPNIYQVVSEVCSMRGTPVPIKDVCLSIVWQSSHDTKIRQIYAQRTQSEARGNQKLPDLTSPVASPPPAGISHASPIKQKQVIPDIAPMRRGRPTASQQPVAAKPGPATAQSDPFAALDSASNTIRARAVDELSAKFPSLDEFSIAHEQGTGFNFSSSKPHRNDPVTSALADEVFARPASARDTPPPKPEPTPTQGYSQTTKPSAAGPKADAPPKPKPLLHQPVPQRPNYASTGTMTSPSPTSTTQPILPKMPDVNKRPIWRVPDHSRSSSQPRASPMAQSDADRLQPSAPPAQRPALLDAHRSKSQTATATISRQTTSSRPSLEGHRPSFGQDEGIGRARSANSKPRPVSAAYIDSNLDYLRGQEAERKRPSLEIRRSSRSIKNTELNFDDANIESDADYLRSLESSEGLSRKSSGKDAAHKKRSSLSSLSFSGTKNMLSGRFGDAFKRFEQTGGEVKAEKGRSSESGFRTPSPVPPVEVEGNLLSPIAGSETTASPPRRAENTNFDLGDLTETEDLPPEMRREMERLQLVQEEKRVAAAAAEYRSRGGAPPVPSKANMIQQRVQSLLDDGQKSPVYKKTAEGYGRFTERMEAEEAGRRSTPTAQPAAKKAPPPVARKPATPAPAPVSAPGEVDMNLRYHKVRQSQSFPVSAGTYNREATAPAPVQRTGPAPRPNAPPKPAVLKTGGSTMSQNRPSSSGVSSPVHNQTGGGRGPSLAALIARDNEGVAAAGAGMEQAMPQEGDFASQADFDDWQADFSKRYPSLSGLEMVEREIAGGGGGGGGREAGRRGMRVRDV